MITYTLVNQSVSASAVYGPVILNDATSMYVQVVAATGVTGTITVQTSADGVSYSNNATTIAVAGTTVEAQTYTLSSQYVRFSYAHTGSAGNLKLVVNLKGVSQ